MNLDFYLIAIFFFTVVWCLFTLPKLLWKRRKQRRQREALARTVKSWIEP